MAHKDIWHLHVHVLMAESTAEESHLPVQLLGLVEKALRLHIVLWYPFWGIWRSHC